MIQIERIRIHVTNDIKVVDMQVSTTAELPDLGENVEGIVIAAGSIAQIIQADSPTFVTLDDDGTWYPEQSDSSESTLNASLSAPKTSAQLGEGKSVLVQDEPEINLDDGFEREIEQPVKEQKKEFVESIEEPEKDGEDDDELL